MATDMTTTGQAARFSGPARLGALIAAVVLVADQVLKLALLHGAGLTETNGFRLAPFLDIVLVWNRGISYGLFQQETAVGRWGLAALTVVAVVALGVWLSRVRHWLAAVSLGLVIGGAIGNGIDRIWYGAVVDFVHFYVGSFSWYVFNIADVAIVAGAAGLVLDSLRGRSGRQ
ncbi:signal peptidase II [Pseudoxanthobacter sp.]|uniref:signal peptidase II n=1 Tax=Pseudoxanthobacter sp. TaxID=1925742 RepID=UPI002FE20D5D